MAASLAEVARINDRVEHWLGNTSRPERKAIMRDLMRQHPLVHLWDDSLGLPRLVTAQQAAMAQRATGDLLEGLRLLELAALGEPRHEQIFHLLYEAAGPEGQSHLCLPYYETAGTQARRFMRADGIFDTTGWYWEMELNVVAPAALPPHDHGTEFSAKLLEVMDISVARPPKFYESLLGWLITEYREHTGDSKGYPRRIAVVMENRFDRINQAIRPTVELMREYCNQQGYPIDIHLCHQANVYVEKGALMASGKPCDLIWRNAARWEGHYSPSMRPSLDDWREVTQNPKEFLIVNGEVGPRAVRTKGALALLWRDDYAALIPGLSPELLGRIREHLPLTYYLDWEQHRLPELIRNWGDWVLKLSDGGHGKGLRIGRNMSQNEFRAFITSEKSRGYVAQRLIVSPVRNYPHIRPSDGVIEHRRLSVDYCPYTLNGETGLQVLGRGAEPNVNGIAVHMMAEGGVFIPTFTV